MWRSRTKNPIGWRHTWQTRGRQTIWGRGNHGMWLSSKKFVELFCKINYLRSDIRSGCVSSTRNNKTRLYIQLFQMVLNSHSQIILCKLHPYRLWNKIIDLGNDLWVFDIPGFQLLCRFCILLVLRLSKSSINIAPHSLAFQKNFIT